MTRMAGTVKNGQVVLDDPAALPDGTRVEVVPMAGDEIATRLALMDPVEPG